jgi:hypothetical protein
MSPEAAIRWLSWMNLSPTGKRRITEEYTLPPPDGRTFPSLDFHSEPDPRIQRWGQGLKSIINAQPPQTAYDFGELMRKNFPGKPVVSHEIGQWCVYPDLKEISQYTGVLKAKNFENI